MVKLQPEGVLMHQSVLLRKTYGFDRKSKHYRLCLFFKLHNAYLLYKHGCIPHNVCAKDSLGFRLELVHMLLKVVVSKLDIYWSSKEN